MRTMTMFRRLTALTALSLSCTAAFVGCSSEGEAISNQGPADEASAQVGESRQALAGTIVERVVPVRVFILKCGTADDATELPTATDVKRELDYANQVWSSTRVQFSLVELREITAPDLCIIKNEANLADGYAPTTAWSQAKAQVTAVDPTIPASSFADTDSTTSYNWLKQTARLMSHHAVPMFITGQSRSRAYVASGTPGCVTDGARCYVGTGGQAGSAMPHDDGTQPGSYVAWGGVWGTDASKGIMFPQKTPGFAHELGHYLGLHHTTDVLSPNTALTGLTKADYYDLIYRVDTVGGIVTYGSKDDVPSSGLFFPKENQYCTINENAACDITCPWYGHLYSASTSTNAFEGLSYQNLAWEHRGTNVMSYLTNTANATCGDALFVSGSQAQIVQQVLRSSKGHRNELGDADELTANDRLDFNGGGGRDIAVWRPASQRDGVHGACIVQTENSGTITLEVTSQAGDMPLIADIDGDGKTDCGVYRKSFTGGVSQWLWRSSRTGTELNISFGGDSDTPLPGLHMTVAGNIEVGLYRRYSGEICWAPLYVSGTTASLGAVTCFQHTPASSAGTAFPSEASVIPGNFDGDWRTDFATYHPTPGDRRMVLSRSSCSWGSGCRYSWTPGSSDYVPLRGVDKNGDGVLDLGVWDKATGTWLYTVDLDGTPSTTSIQWGLSTDVPLEGYDIDADGKSDEVVYRRGSSSYQGAFIYRRSSNGSSLVTTGGYSLDVPFLSQGGTPWLFRRNGFSWLKYVGSNWTTTQWGQLGDLPL